MTFLDKASYLLFKPALGHQGMASWLATGAVLVGLYAGGIVHWLLFLNFGDLSFLDEQSWDWRKEFFSYSILRQAITEGTIPYTVPYSYFTDKFLGNLEPVFSPQVLLLPLMSLGQFVLVNTVLMYTLGFAGCLLIMAKHGLSLMSFTFVFLLFNFNGHITSHLSVGHTMWNGYFLLPFYVLLVLELVQGPNPPRVRLPVSLGLVLFGILLQGSFHIYIWCLIFLGLVGLANRRLRAPAMLSLAFSLLLSAFRLAPAVFAYGGHKGSYASGFPTLSTFVDALTTIKAHTFEHPRGPLYDVGWWEHDTFIGIVGVLLVAYFGIYHRFSNREGVQALKFQALDLPLLLMVLFSFGLVFDLVSDLRIPFLSWLERLPSRMFVIPLVVLVVITALRIEALFRQGTLTATARLLAVVAAVLLAHSLAVHSWFWRVSDSTFLKVAGGGVPVGLPRLVVLNDPSQYDLIYSTVVKVGAAITVMAVLGLGWLYFRDLVRQRAGALPEPENHRCWPG